MNYFFEMTYKTAKIAASKPNGIEGREKITSEHGGGLDMKVDQHKERIRHTFDYYIKHSLKREVWNEHREMKKRLLNEVVFSDLPDELINSVSFFDSYEWERTSFAIAGDIVMVQNEALAQALLQLTEEERNILLMYWFLHMADREIALQMKLARRTVNDRRRKSYCKLVKLMKGGPNV